MAIDERDEEVHPRCPPLGGEVPFRHCRTVNRGLPCHRVLVCWLDRFDVVGFLRTHYTDQEIQAMSRPPEPRLAVILETLDRVRRSQGS